MPTPRRRYLVDLLGRVWRLLVIYAGVFLSAGIAFFLLESPRYSLPDSLYWSIVTLGTVGYGDIVPTSLASKALASAVIATQIFLLGYLLTVITSAVTEESQRRMQGTYGTSFEGHVVVLGYSAVGQAAVRELLAQGQRVAVVAERSDELPNIRALAEENRLFVTFGAPAQREVIERTNIARAHSAIICSSDDAQNLIGALNLRSMNPSLRIVVAVARPELRETLKAAGVTYVASPSDLGGRMCASAAFEPDVADILEDVTAADVSSDIQEYVVLPSSPVADRTFQEADEMIRRASGCLLIGTAKPDGKGDYRTTVNPPFDTPIHVGDALVLIGSIPNTKRFRGWFGSDQGR